MDAGEAGAADSAAQRARLAWVDAARGVAIIFVVLLHARDWLLGAGFDVHVWHAPIELMNGLRMPVFFALSGILAVRWLTASWRDLLSIKVLLLGWVYLLWQVIGSVTAVVASRITGGHLSAARMIASLAATPVRPRFELWFLWVLIVFFLVARAAGSLSVPAGVLLAVAFGFSAVFLSDLVHEGNLGWYGVPKYFAFFLLGIHYRGVVEWAVARYRRSRVLCAVVVGVWFAAALALYVSGADQYVGPDLLVRLLGLSAGLALAVVLARWRLLTYLGSRTLPVYLAHTTFIILIVDALRLVRPPAGAGVVGALLPPLLTLAVIPASLALHRAAVRTWLRVLYRPPRRLGRALGAVSSVSARP